MLTLILRPDNLKAASEALNYILTTRPPNIRYLKRSSISRSFALAGTPGDNGWTDCNKTGEGGDTGHDGGTPFVWLRETVRSKSGSQNLLARRVDSSAPWRRAPQHSAHRRTGPGKTPIPRLNVSDRSWISNSMQPAANRRADSSDGASNGVQPEVRASRPARSFIDGRQGRLRTLRPVTSSEGSRRTFVTSQS